jgi:hypothetical protein
MFNLNTCPKLVVTFEIISTPIGHDFNYFNKFCIFFVTTIALKVGTFFGVLRFWNKVWGLNIFQTKWLLCHALRYQ